ncbi:MAG: sigma 54-interacting transcriptional regulator [Polyangiaceae bacterium]|nr:sigma 54-interacting transcriptional regulator [Polyangiaceae bacterium]
MNPSSSASMSHPFATPDKRVRARLSWTDGAGSHTVDVHHARTAGKAPECDLVVSDRAVSRIHAEIAPREDGLWVRDLGSVNGTFIGGVKVNEGRVPQGASIRLGTTEIAVTYGAHDEAPALWPEERFGTLLAASVAMREVFATVASLASMDTSVLFVGEPSTGKQSLARMLHETSPRAGSPLIVVDCAALPEPVLAAEVLEDALRSAEGGTLLLEEPQELSLALQRELLPPLAARVFRVVASTSRDLRPLVNQNALREGLYFRLAGATVNVPALRDRPADVPLLLKHFLGDDAPLLTTALLDDLAWMPWTGNVRELRRVAEHLRSSGGVLGDWPSPPEPYEESVMALEGDAFHDTVEVAGRTQSDLPVRLEPWFGTGFKEFRERWIELGEREYLRRLMARTNRSSSKASREAGLERTYLYRLLKKHGV